MLGAFRDDNPGGSQQPTTLLVTEFVSDGELFNQAGDRLALFVITAE